MRALAKFIMRGRLQAAVVALFGNLLPFISPATVGLVVLRKGPQEGLLTLMWAALPTVLLVESQVFVELVTSIALLVILWLAADQLRRSMSWPRTFLAVMILSGLTGVMLDVGLAEGELIEQAMQSLEKITGQRPETLEIDRISLLSLITVWMAIAVMLSLFLARWWQSMLYNPGGFQTEFHQLRFQFKEAALMVGAVLVCTMLGGDFTAWINLLAMPLLFAGIALVHWLIAQRKMGLQTLVLFYIGLIVLMPLFVPMLVVIGFTDSIVNLRPRLSSGAN